MFIGQSEFPTVDGSLEPGASNQVLLAGVTSSEFNFLATLTQDLQFANSSSRYNQGPAGSTPHDAPNSYSDFINTYQGAPPNTYLLQTESAIWEYDSTTGPLYRSG